MKTVFYNPQSNAAERVNQSILNTIRTYLDEDHREWDMYLSEIECTLHCSTIGVNPFFALLGFHMFSCGSDYKLARKLKSLSDHELHELNRDEKLELIREKITQNMLKPMKKILRY